MGFLSPLFLLGLLAIAVPIALHLFRHQAGPVMPFSAVRFLRKAPLQRARRRRLQDVLLLLLRVAALALLALSFARPYVVSTEAGPGAPLTIVALDRSFSLSAPGQAERARDLASQVIDELPGGERIAVLAFDERAETLLPPTTDRREAQRVVSAFAPGYGATRYAAALAAARELAGARRGRLVIVSDLQQSGWEGGSSPAPEGLAVETRAVETPASNLGVTDLGRTREGLVASVQNAGSSERRTSVSLQLDGRAIASRAIAVPPRSTARVVFADALPQRGAVSVQVEDGVGYTADDRRFAVLDQPTRLRLLLVVGAGGDGGEGFYLTRAIAAAEGGAGMAVDALSADKVASRAEDLNRYAAVALLGSRGFDARAGEALANEAARGCGLIVVAGPELDWPWLASQVPAALGLRAARPESVAGGLSFAPADVRHPVFRAFASDGGSLGGVRFSRVVRLTAPRGGRVLAQFADGTPALIELTGAPGRTLIFASDLANGWNDFALHPAFVPFVHELVRYAAAERPSRREVRVGTRRGTEWAQPGVVTDRTGDTEERVAVNVDVREADRSVMTQEAFLAAVPRATAPAGGRTAEQARARESDQSLWRYGLVVMLIALVAESVIGRKT